MRGQVATIRLSRRISLVWLFLVIATLASFESSGLVDERGVRAIVLLIAFAKVLLVGREFMELRHAPAWMLWLFQAWVAIVCLTLQILVW